LNLLDDHLDNCVSQALAQGGNEAEVGLRSHRTTCSLLINTIEAGGPSPIPTRTDVLDAGTLPGYRPFV
jgi:hypothetical protein